MKKAFRLLDKLEEALLVVLMVAMTLAVVVQVVSRVVFHNSLAWTEETARYMLVWITFVGASLGVKRGAHIGVEALTRKLPAKAKRIVQLVMIGISAFFCFVVSLSSIQILLLQAKTNQVSAAVQIPMWIPYLGVTLGIFMMGIRFIELFVNTLSEAPVSASEGSEEVH